MQTAQHIEASQRFLDDALALDSGGSPMGAAEMIWGAAVQVLEAIGHIRAGNERGKLSGNGRRRMAESIAFEGRHRYYRTQNELHGHFYDGHLTSEKYTDSMRQGREFVTELLAIAQSPGGQ